MNFGKILDRFPDDHVGRLADDAYTWFWKEIDPQVDRRVADIPKELQGYASASDAPRDGVVRLLRDHRLWKHLEIALPIVRKWVDSNPDVIEEVARALTSLGYDGAAAPSVSASSQFRALDRRDVGLDRQGCEVFAPGGSPVAGVDALDATLAAAALGWVVPAARNASAERPQGKRHGAEVVREGLSVDGHDPMRSSPLTNQRQANEVDLVPECGELLGHLLERFPDDYLGDLVDDAYTWLWKEIDPLVDDRLAETDPRSWEIVSVSRARRHDVVRMIRERRLWRHPEVALRIVRNWVDRHPDATEHVARALSLLGYDEPTARFDTADFRLRELDQEDALPDRRGSDVFAPYGSLVVGVDALDATLAAALLGWVVPKRLASPARPTSGRAGEKGVPDMNSDRDRHGGVEEASHDGKPGADQSSATPGHGRTPDDGTGVGDGAASTSLKARYLQLFSYLRDFAKLRERVVRDIADYEEVVFFDETPNTRGNACITWPDSDRAAVEWIRMKRPKEPPIRPPQLPSALEKWVTPDSLEDPDVIPEIGLAETTPSGTAGEPPPFVRDSLERYVAQSWAPWAECIKRYRIEIDVYQRLFRIHDRAQKFAEQYELVVGLGLLFFKDPARVPVRRHVLVAQAGIEFDPESARFSVHEGGDGCRLRVETDMIQDLGFGDAQRAANAAKADIERRELVENPFSAEIGDVLRALVHSIHPKGLYEQGPNASGEVRATPTIYDRPALVLRKRTSRGIVAMIEDIIAQIGASMDPHIPILDDLVLDAAETEVTTPEPGEESGRPFFSRPFNDEQLGILQRLVMRDKVLVQGPPGTGKSHTIANLVGHLLAKGKRVLVTAYTKRALTVLKGLIPDAIRPLCVNLLGNDRESMDDLEASVRGINARLTQYDERTAAASIRKGTKELDEAGARIVELRRELVSRRSRETDVHQISPAYRGTILELSRIVHDGASAHAWFADAVPDLEAAQSMVGTVVAFAAAQARAKDMDQDEMELALPVEEAVPSLAVMEQFVGLRTRIDQECRQATGTIAKQVAGRVAARDTQAIAGARKELVRLVEDFVALSAFADPWALTAVTECTTGNGGPWAELLSQTDRVLTKRLSSQLRRTDPTVGPEYPAGAALESLRKDTLTLIDYLKDGRRLRGLELLKPRAVRDALYVAKGSRVGDVRCADLDTLQLLLSYIDLEIAVTKLTKLWGDHAPKSDVPAIQMQRFLAQREQLAVLLPACEGFKKRASSLSSVLSAACFPSGFRMDLEADVRAALDLAVVFDQLVAFQDMIDGHADSLRRPIKGKKRHPICGELGDCLTRADLAGYSHLLAKVPLLRERQTFYGQYASLRRLVPTHFPDLATRIVDGSAGFGEVLLEGRLADAMEWRHAQTKLQEAAHQQDQAAVQEEIKRIETRIGQLKSELAAELGWKALHANMSPAQRAHLVAWFGYVKKIGRGTGKNAARYRKLAQAEMDACREAIPAWVMPLHQVAETVAPRPGVFDVVIIDEASQLGADAVALLYLAQKVLIVGDDKQTAPEYVGVSKDPVDELINRHLRGIPFKEYYGLEFSFFDHAERFCAPYGARIGLREHFRCMPEIIEFSNQCFYAPFGTALQPMRQYSERRLPPLRSVLVASGQCLGHGSDLVNEAEAAALVERIARCVDAPEYAGKTFGVIALQGFEQAKLIEKLLLERVGAEEMERRSVVCGNSSSFQGDERQVMFLSLVVSRDYSFRALTSDADRRRFNVAMSRARDQVWLFHSVTLDDLPNRQDLRYMVLAYFVKRAAADVEAQPVRPYTPLEGSRNGAPPEPFGSWFEVDVCEGIRSRSYEVRPQFRVASYRIDLVVVLPNGTRIAVECDGDIHQDPEQHERDILRQLILERCGWQFFRLRGYDYYSDPEAALVPLWALLERNGGLEYYAQEPQQSVEPAEEAPPTVESDDVEGPAALRGPSPKPAEPLFELEPDRQSEPGWKQLEVELTLYSQKADAGEQQVETHGDTSEQPPLDSNSEALLEYTLCVIATLSSTTVPMSRKDILRDLPYGLANGAEDLRRIELALIELEILATETHLPSYGPPSVLYRPRKSLESVLKHEALTALETALATIGFVQVTRLSRPSTSRDRVIAALATARRAQHEGALGQRQKREAPSGPPTAQPGEVASSPVAQAIPPRPSRHPSAAASEEKGVDHTANEDLVPWFSAVAPEEWFALSGRAKQGSLVEGWERKFLYDMGKYAANGWTLSMKQLRVARRLFLMMTGSEKHPPSPR